MKPRTLTGILLAALLPMSFCLPCHAEQPSQTDRVHVAASSVDKARVPDRSSERIYNLPGLANTGRIAPGIYRGALPEIDGYVTLHKLGVKTVIDMRTNGSEKANVEALGMKSISIPIRMSRNGLQEKVDQVVALMANPANHPIYVHCRHGQDRTGIVVAAYRMKHQGWSLSAAEAEMQAFGFNDVWVNFKQFIRHYGKQIEAKRSLAGSNTK